MDVVFKPKKLTTSETVLNEEDVALLLKDSGYSNEDFELKMIDDYDEKVKLHNISEEDYFDDDDESKLCVL